MNTVVSPSTVPFTFVLDWLSGVSPVEADGTVDGHSWYYRGKASRWEFVVARASRIAPIDLALRFDPVRGFRLWGAEAEVGNQSEGRLRALITWAACQFHQSETTGELVLCCATCPARATLTERLAQHGLRLTFHMRGEREQSEGSIPALPAQDHYRADDDREVLFLAGRDRIERGLPPHASRFWLVRGTDAVAFRRLIDAVTRDYPVVAPRSR